MRSNCKNKKLFSKKKTKKKLKKKPIIIFQNKLNFPLRNHITNRKIKLDLTKTYNQDKKSENIFKPSGFWYSCKKSWYNWCYENMSDRLGKYLYEVNINNTIGIDNINKDKILIIDNKKDFKKFGKKYKKILKGQTSIDWNTVSKDYGGIEICPYLSDFRMNDNYEWYYTWDVASGCIWNLKPIIKSIKLKYILNNGKYKKI
jgi:hypothetical protein